MMETGWRTVWRAEGREGRYGAGRGGLAGGGGKGKGEGEGRGGGR